MRRRLLVVIAGLLLGLAPAAQAQKADADVQKLIDQYVAAYQKGDAKALTAMYVADAVRVTPAGQLLVGREAIGKDYAMSMAALAGAKLAIKSGRVQTVAPDVRIMEGTYEVSGVEGGPVRGRYVNTIVRQGGQWQLASVVTLPDTAPMK